MADSGRLQQWVQQQLAAGVPALAGARVQGTVPVQVTLLNELIAGALEDAASGRLGGGASAGRGASGVDLSTLARMVRRLHVDAAPGVVTLDFEVGAGG